MGLESDTCWWHWHLDHPPLEPMPDDPAERDRRVQAACDRISAALALPGAGQAALDKEAADAGCDLDALIVRLQREAGAPT